jgi:hypothetical protein
LPGSDSALIPPYLNRVPWVAEPSDLCRSENRVDNAVHPPPYLEARSIHRKEYGNNRFSGWRLILEKVIKMTLTLQRS